MKKRVLVVENDPAVRHMLCRLLNDEAYAVTAAADYVEALRDVAHENTDLVLLDLNQPGKEECAAFVELRRKHPLLPVIVILGSTRSLPASLAAAAAAVLQKPLDLTDLLDNVRGLLPMSIPSSQPS